MKSKFLLFIKKYIFISKATFLIFVYLKLNITKTE